MANYQGDNNSNTFLTTTGSDTVKGLGGDDWVVMYGGVDNVDGGTGHDTMSFMAATNGVVIDLGLATAQATGFGTVTASGVEGLIGSNYTDVLIGNGASNVIAGWGGNDTLSGLGGDDWLRGGLGNDKFLGGIGNDTASFQSTETNGVRVDLRLTGAQNTNEGSDTFTGIENLFGSDKNDVLMGNNGANIISGNGGNDALNGGLGSDTLWGGAGRDTFVWNVLYAGTDTIRDFVRGQDRIDINSWVANTGWTIAQLEFLHVNGNTEILLYGDPNYRLVVSGNHTFTAVDFVF